MRIVTGADGLQAHEMIALFDVSGWGSAADYDPQRIQRAIAHTQVVIQAREGERLVGLLRGFSDGVLVTHVSELLVHPAFRAKGIGTALVEALKSNFPLTNVYVDAFPENQRFFERFGLKHRVLLRPMTASAHEWAGVEPKESKQPARR